MLVPERRDFTSLLWLKACKKRMRSWIIHLGYIMKSIFLSLAVFLLSACATSVNVDYKKDVNFAQIKTFLVQVKPVSTAVDTRIDNPLMQQRIVKAIRDELVQKGLSANQSNHDVVVKYHLSVKQEIESNNTGFALGFGTASHHSFLGMSYIFPERETSSVDNLILTIDMLDDRGSLLWRGSLARRLYDGSTPESNTTLINDLVRQILSQFPPK